MACVTTDESGPGTAGGFCHDETNVEAGEPQQERGSAEVGDPRFGAEAGEQGLCTIDINSRRPRLIHLFFGQKVYGTS